MKKPEQTNIVPLKKGKVIGEEPAPAKVYETPTAIERTHACDVTIGALNATNNQVEVTFSYAGVTHTRQVNAVLTEDGAYDKAATKARVDEVAFGVEAKIKAGAIKNPPPAPELPVLDAEKQDGESSED